ncbi:hypothetical protein BC643_1853 [Mangrovibacterium diazotrophicum]|uniref:Uncharacterized protein n=1 Tax=Mangrovibacterium diazotrophicum TaxID=1261403 RepID=A0A419W7P3_9BACT|nr:hypothetical protein BC643_1853 [Mangrovibacterium diazotrophicum]
MKCKMSSFIFMIIVAFVVSGCHDEDVHRYIYLQNNSDKTIYYGISYSYPDTAYKILRIFRGETGIYLIGF